MSEHCSLFSVTLIHSASVGSRTHSNSTSNMNFSSVLYNWESELIMAKKPKMRFSKIAHRHPCEHLQPLSSSGQRKGSGPAARMRRVSQQPRWNAGKDRAVAPPAGPLRYCSLGANLGEKPGTPHGEPRSLRRFCPPPHPPPPRVPPIPQNAVRGACGRAPSRCQLKSRENG